MLTNNQIEKLLQKIHSGELSVFNLPQEIFEFTYSELMTVVDKGFGGGVGDFVEGSPRALKATAYRDNIFKFSGAKVFNEVKDISLLIFNEDGTKRSFKEFKEFGRAVNQKYNVDWLRTEQDTAFGMAQGADQWADIEEDKELFPMLQYQTANDERVRDDHAAYDNIIMPVDDPFWDTRMPPNGWNCRCQVIKLHDGKKTNLKTHLKEYNKKREAEKLPKLTNLKNPSKTFSVNPGKVNYVFDEKTHPYFKVEKRFKPMLKDNFGFKIHEK